MTRHLDPVIVDLPYSPMTISTGCQRLKVRPCDSRPSLHPSVAKLFIWITEMQKVCPQNLTHLGYVKLNGFHDNL